MKWKLFLSRDTCIRHDMSVCALHCDTDYDYERRK